MNHLTTFTPLMRQTVGFDRFNDLFESLLGDKEERFEAYPPYNIEKSGENAYRITLAVAGFDEGDLTVVTQDDRLIVSGRHQNEQNDLEGQFLHKGIATRAFERTFRLADHIRVTQADLSNGLLRIDLLREVPEEAKPRMIPIGQVVDAGAQSALLSKKKDKSA